MARFHEYSQNQQVVISMLRNPFLAFLTSVGSPHHGSVDGIRWFEAACALLRNSLSPRWLRHTVIPRERTTYFFRSAGFFSRKDSCQALERWLNFGNADRIWPELAPTQELEVRYLKRKRGEWLFFLLIKFDFLSILVVLITIQF